MRATVKMLAILSSWPDMKRDRHVQDTTALKGPRPNQVCSCTGEKKNIYEYSKVGRDEMSFYYPDLP